MDYNTSARPDSLGRFLRLLTSEENYADVNGNSSMSNFSCSSPDMNTAKIIVTGLYMVVFSMGLVGNLMVIYVVLRFSNMQTVTNMYILNLAIADVCFLLGIPFLMITVHHGSWMFGRIVCKAYMISTSITQFTSSIFLLIMAADRYIAICHHISSPKYRTPGVSRFVSAVVWCVSSAIMAPILMYAGTIETGENRFSCNVEWPEWGEHAPGFTFTIYSVMLGFVIPLAFIITFYLLVVRKLQVVSKNSSKSKSKRRSHRKVTKLVVTVIAVYILCWSPHWVAQVALITTQNDSCPTRLYVILYLLVGLLGYMNSAINPILYAYLSENFKKSFHKACPFFRRRDINTPTNISNQIPRSTRECRPSESQLTVTTRCANTFLESNTITTGVSNVSSRNPSPPNGRNGSIPATEQESEMVSLTVAA